MSDTAEIYDQGEYNFAYLDEQTKRMSKALFDKYGGFKSVSRIVMAFYDKVLDSDQIGDYFDEIDMPKLIDHQTKFISALLGGPVSYSDERLRRAHASLELTHEDFDEVSRLLQESLAEHALVRTHTAPRI